MECKIIFKFQKILAVRRETPSVDKKNCENADWSCEQDT